MTPGTTYRILGKLLGPALLFSGLSAPAATLYVDLNSVNPTPPYADWSTAATNIQDAVDVSAAGDLVLVTNGVYQTGGRTSQSSSLTNRVTIDKPIGVQSVNGPVDTVIQGYWLPGTTNGSAAIRCAYLTNGAALAGFTLQGGATQTPIGSMADLSGGGILCEPGNALVSNCVVSANASYYFGGGVYRGTLINCLLTNNISQGGGAAYSSVLNNCTLAANRATGTGGGAYSSTLTNCTLNGNWSGGGGGGVYFGTLSGCILVSNLGGMVGGGGGRDMGGNVGGVGGGAYSANLYDCTLAWNYDPFGGGGAYFGILNNCLLVSNSVIYGDAGPGGGANSCTMTNCTLTGNWGGVGGGVSGGTLYNCILSGNRAINGGEAGGGRGGGAISASLNNCVLTGNSSYAGGGAYACTLNNCALRGNSGVIAGGGAYQCVMNGCTVVSNSAYMYGGVYTNTLNNCIVYFNNSTVTPANFGGQTNGSMNFCCTTPQPPGGVGNITNDPAIVDYLNGNLRLSLNSPCINSGNNAKVATATDLDGNPRIAGRTLDIGAYEFQSPASTISYAWLQQNGLPTDGSADAADSDGDGMSNLQEWIAGTDPHNAASALKILSASGNASGVTITWQSTTNRTFLLRRGSDFSNPSAFSIIKANIAGLAGTTSFTDTSATNAGPYFYRVGVQP